MGAKSRAATLYSVGSTSDPDHEAAIRFDGEAPRRRAHSNDGSTTMFRLGSPPPRIVISGLRAYAARRGAETLCCFLLLFCPAPPLTPRPSVT
jgi:hypothetical protein